MHARAAKKRNENMHKAGALILMTLAIAASVWLAIAGFGKMNKWLFSENDRFIVRHLEISTTGRLSEAHIKEFGSIGLGANLFDIDIGSIRGKLEDGPLIKNAEVQRKLPGTLVIRVNERIPLARIAHGKSMFYFSVDRDGHILGLAGPVLSTMPIITGHDDKGLTPGDVLHDSRTIDALNVIGICDSSPISQVVSISSIDVSHSDYLSVSLEDNIKVLLPRNASRRKLEDLVVYLREAGGRISFIDLTVDRNVPAT